MQNILIESIGSFSRVLQYIILIRIIVSWIHIDPNNPIMQLLHAITEPILGPIRKLMYKSPLGGAGMMIDFSPIVATLLIEASAQLLMNIVSSL